MRPTRPCLTCGTLTTKSRCRDCDRERNRIWQGSYRDRAREVRETAITCWLCGQGARPDDPWTADHVIPANPNSELRPAHRSCNSSRGART